MPCCVHHSCYGCETTPQQCYSLYAYQDTVFADHWSFERWDDKSYTSRVQSQAGEAGLLTAHLAQFDTMVFFDIVSNEK